MTAHATVIAGDDGSWRVVIETTGSAGPGRRELRARTCPELADATALILALMIDPNAGQTTDGEVAAPETATPPAPPSQPAENSAVPEATPPPVAPQATAGRTWTTIWMIGPDLSAGAPTMSLRSPTFGVGGTVALSIGSGVFRVILEVTALGWLPARYVMDGVTQVGGNVKQLSLMGAACPAIARGRVDAGLCALGGVDRATARAFGPSNLEARSETSAWTSLGAGGMVQWNATNWLAIPIKLEALIALRHPAFVIEGLQGVVYEPAPITLRGLVGARLTFR